MSDSLDSSVSRRNEPTSSSSVPHPDDDTAIFAAHVRQYGWYTDSVSREHKVQLNALFGHTTAKQHRELLKTIKSTAVRRYINKPKIVFDICCGSNSMAKYYLRLYPDAIVISIDIMDKGESLDSVPTYLRPRVKFEHFDIANLTVDALNDMVRRHTGRTLADVYAYHFSPDCSTYTSRSSSY